MSAVSASREAGAFRGWPLAAGLAVSLLVHAGAAVVVTGVELPGPDGGAGADERANADRPRQTFGKEDSKAASISWLGFDRDPTPHESTVEADTDQAATTTDSADGAGDGVPEPPETPAPSGAAGPVGPPLPPGGGASPPASDAATPADAVPPPARKRDESGTVPLPSVQQDPESVPATNQPLPAPEPTEETQPTPKPAPSPAPGSEGGGSPASAEGADAPPTAREGEGGAKRRLPGDPMDRESTAAAIESAVDARLGRPLVGEGLEIKTVVPEWPDNVRATVWPRDPIVELDFRRDGTVSLAGFLVGDVSGPGEPRRRRRFDTGSERADEPLLDALYRWRAEGKAIEALGPGETLRVTVRIRLR